MGELARGKVSVYLVIKGVVKCGFRTYPIIVTAVLLVTLLLVIGGKVAEGQQCRKVVLPGAVAGGHEWSARIGEGWLFRVVPIAAGARRYSGWDLVVDREGAGGGYPDGLLLMTPPYGSLNEREIGTTFGLRAQDALGWGPRNFHFLSSRGELARARALFPGVVGSVTGDAEQRRLAETSLLEMAEAAPRGRFAITGARLVTGTGDPLPFARQWATAFANVPHTTEQAGGPTSEPASGERAKRLRAGDESRGEIHWISFAVTLWLPRDFRLQPGFGSNLERCAE